jgi:hypothetical protein
MAFLSDLFGASGVAALGGKIADIVKSRVPDVNAQAAMQADLEKMLLSQDFQLAQGQAEINKVEAASGSLFVAGARPAVIWVAVGALLLATWPKAIVLTVFWGMQAYASLRHGSPIPPYPTLDTGDLMAMLGSLLGVGIPRTLEKMKGVATMRLEP